MSASSSLFRLEAFCAAGAAASGGAVLLAVADHFLTAGVLAGAGAVSAAGGLAQARLVRGELVRGRAVLGKLRRGDFEARVTGIADRGPVGALLKGINDFADRADAFVREARASLQAVGEQRFHRRIMERGMQGGFLNAAEVVNRTTSGMAARLEGFRQVTGRFESTLDGIVGTVAASATQLRATAESMAGAAAQSSEQALGVSTASDRASGNVQTVAAAAEELSASISEIASQVARSAEVARGAAARAEATDGQVGRLAEAAGRIGEVVALIKAIASQTNLLALNVTIEAARAGEAGKGFAVVAQEVKNLANQTAQATEEIGGQVAAIQAATGDAVAAIRAIAEVIADVNGSMAAIAAAVEEQAAATGEIARSVEQASAGTAEVSSRITGVRAAAAETGAASRQVLGAAGELSRQSEQLDRELGSFLGELRRVV